METKQLEKEFLDMIAAQKRIIYKVCYIYAKDRDDLNDLFQEVVLNLWKGFPHYRGNGKQSTWVYSIAMKTCITFLRRLSVRPQTIPMTVDVDGMTAEAFMVPSNLSYNITSANWGNWNARWFSFGLKSAAIRRWPKSWVFPKQMLP